MWRVSNVMYGKYQNNVLNYLKHFGYSATCKNEKVERVLRYLCHRFKIKI